MRTAAERSSPPQTVDDGWRDLISSAPPPPPAPPREAYEHNATLPAGLHTDRQGCVTRVQFAESEPERPSFDAGDRRLWMVAGGLMGLATVVLLLLGVLTFKPATQEPPAQSAAPPVMVQHAKAATTTPAEVSAPALAGTGRPLLAQHALRHVKHARKHKKLAAR